MRPMTTIAALFACALASGCHVRMGWGEPDVWVEETERFDVNAGDVEGLAAITQNGAITVRAAEPGVETIEVSATKRAGGDDEADAREALACLHVARRHDGSTLTLESEWGRSPRSNWESVVSFEIVAPERLAARLESHNGAVTVDGIAGSLDVLSHNGRLRLDAPARRVAAKTSNGAIEYRGPAEELALESQNGAVRAALTGGPVNGRISTSNGAVVVDADGAMRGTIEGGTHNGRVAIHAAAGGCTIRDDWFRVEFPDPHAGRLEVSTHNGSIEVR